MAAVIATIFSFFFAMSISVSPNFFEYDISDEFVIFPLSGSNLPIP